MKEEVWKPVLGYEGFYEISDLGNVRSLPHKVVDSKGRICLKRGKRLKTKIGNKTGYHYVNLSKNGKKKTVCVHRIIAEAFIPNPNNLPCVNHIDEDRGNSVLSNLEWCTYLYNNIYGRAIAKRKDSIRKNLEGKHKTIYQFSKCGRLIKEYTCGVSQLSEILGYDISQNLTGASKTSHGYIFSYNSIFSYIKDKPKAHQKYVIKYDANGSKIEEYASISEAGRKNGFDRHIFQRRNQIDGKYIINGMYFTVEKKLQ